ncbi:regulating synaptic membrane exocytosis protein 1-like isoform X3 [Dromiciops gliroides]|uniref:regulating synaptic membrane exocytosis protein 1-like isoform X3 n=1 Tax=Dromiciops gliroides TaxID=33562 RepID=UPI001CC5FDF3|nr:regulating synaptic membrane exocytosis protein 1-like isoform X3 [Dromiciops gliroides]
MSSSSALGPRGPRPPTVPPPMQELPDLSHLTEEERNIIMAVMDRQKEEEEKEEAMLKRLHQQFESYKEQVRKIGEEARRYQGEHKDDAPTCGICLKTKFADGCGHLCSYCRTKFCARCGGRVSLRSNNEDKVVMWVCNLCRKQQGNLNQVPELGFLGVDLSPPLSRRGLSVTQLRGAGSEVPREKKARLPRTIKISDPLKHSSSLPGQSLHQGSHSERSKGKQKCPRKPWVWNKNRFHPDLEVNPLEKGRRLRWLVSRMAKWAEK